MDTPTRLLDMGKQLPRRDEGMLSLGLIDFADPRVFDHADDELSCFALCGFIRSAIAEPGLVDRLSPSADRCLIIFLDGSIVNDGRMRQCNTLYMLLCLG